jgi:hypothetical protein
MRILLSPLSAQLAHAEKNFHGYLWAAERQLKRERIFHNEGTMGTKD